LSEFMKALKADCLRRLGWYNFNDLGRNGRKSFLMHKRLLMSSYFIFSTMTKPTSICKIQFSVLSKHQTWWTIQPQCPHPSQSLPRQRW